MLYSKVHNQQLKSTFRGGQVSNIISFIIRFDVLGQKIVDICLKML